MACALKVGVSASGSDGGILKQKVSQPLPSMVQFNEPKVREIGGLSCQFLRQSLVVSDHKRLEPCNPRPPTNSPLQAQASFSVSKAMRWWEKTLKPNMVEINSAQELVDELINAGDKLVIVHFYSPGCGGCKSLHPKICQLAESNPDAICLKINHEKLKPVCHALHVYVLPFFRFYRGAQGKVCSFSCTVATVNKFKTALANYGAERCSLGPAKGLDESELQRLASIGELSLESTHSSSENKEKLEDLGLENLVISNPLTAAGNTLETNEENNAMLISKQ